MNKIISPTRKKKSFEANIDPNILISNNNTTTTSILRKKIKNDIMPNSIINYININSHITMIMIINTVLIVNQQQ